LLKYIVSKLCNYGFHFGSISHINQLEIVSVDQQLLPTFETAGNMVCH